MYVAVTISFASCVPLSSINRSVIRFSDEKFYADKCFFKNIFGSKTVSILDRSSLVFEPPTKVNQYFLNLLNSSVTRFQLI